MTRIGIFLIYVGLAVGLFVQTIPAADIGAQVGDFRLKDEAGNTHTLISYSGKIVVFVFWSFRCPSAIRYADRLDILQNKYDKSRVVVVGVSTGTSETIAAIKANKANLRVNIPILLDRDGSLAAMLGATYIPSVFIIDGNARLQYRGAIDNDKQIGDRKRRAFAEDAIDAVLSGTAIAVRETEAKGCMIRP